MRFKSRDLLRMSRSSAHRCSHWRERGPLHIAAHMSREAAPCAARCGGGCVWCVTVCVTMSACTMPPLHAAAAAATAAAIRARDGHRPLSIATLILRLTRMPVGDPSCYTSPATAWASR